MKRHSDSTLMHMTKAELIEYVRMAEHNQDAAETGMRQQAENLKDWEPVRHGHWMPLPDAPEVVGMRNADQSGASYADNPTLAEA